MNSPEKPTTTTVEKPNLYAWRFSCVANPSQCYYTTPTDSYGHTTVTVGIGFEGDYYLYLYRNYGVNYGGEWGSQTDPVGTF